MPRLLYWFGSVPWMCLRAILICLLILFDHYDDICAIMYCPFESFCILAPFENKGHFGHFVTYCVILIKNLIHAHIMICDERLYDILLIYYILLVLNVFTKVGFYSVLSILRASFGFL